MFSNHIEMNLEINTKMKFWKYTNRRKLTNIHVSEGRAENPEGRAMIPESGVLILRGLFPTLKPHEVCPVGFQIAWDR